jgi:acetolactate synthase-1/2/3 large subunit
MGKGAIAAGHPLYLGNVGMHGTPQANTALGNCDLLLAVGTRFSDRIIGDPELFAQQGDRTIIHVDIDLAEIGKNIRPDIEIEDDAAAFFEEMLQRGRTKPTATMARMVGQLQAIGKRYSLGADKYQDTSPLRPQYNVHEVAERLKGHNPDRRDGCRQHQIFAAQHYPVASPRSFITSGCLGTMGFGCRRRLARRCQTRADDGALLRRRRIPDDIQELGTLATLQRRQNPDLRQQLPGPVRHWPELFFDRRYSNTLRQQPDFVAMGKPTASRRPGRRRLLAGILSWQGPG